MLIQSINHHTFLCYTKPSFGVDSHSLHQSFTDTALSKMANRIKCKIAVGKGRLCGLRFVGLLRRVYSREARGRGEEGSERCWISGWGLGSDGLLGPRERGRFLDKRGKWWTRRDVVKKKSLCSIRNCPWNFACPSNYTHEDTSSY